MPSFFTSGWDFVSTLASYFASGWDFVSTLASDFTSSTCTLVSSTGASSTLASISDNV